MVITYSQSYHSLSKQYNENVLGYEYIKQTLNGVNQEVT